MRRTILGLMLSSWVCGFGATTPSLPDTPKHPVVDEYHGVKVTDNYRWLEQNTPEVKAWVDAENVVTRSYFDALPEEKSVSARVSELVHSNSVAYALEVRRAGKYFGYKVDPKLQQPTIVELASLDQPEFGRTLLDPNTLDAKGAIEIDWFVVSPDAKKIAVSLSSGGSEKGDLHLYDVASGKEVDEVVPHVQNGTAGGSVAFAPDGNGYWYTRYPRGDEHAPEDAGFYQQIWYHRIGRPTAEDTYELGKDFPKIAEIALTAKRDGKWILADVKNGDGGEVAYYLRRTEANSPWIKVADFKEKIFAASFGDDATLYLASREGALRGKVLRLDLDKEPALANAQAFVPESDGAIQAILATGSRLYIDDLLGGPSRVRVYNLQGKRLDDLPILPVSSIQGLVRGDGDDVAFQNGSYLLPPAWYYY